MATAQTSLATADDDKLVRLITAAAQRLVVVAPGLRESVAKAVAAQWQALGPTNVRVTLDTDPEVVRLGVGDTTTLELLQQTAQRLGAVLWRQPGLGIGIVVSDGNTLVFSPGPQFTTLDGAPARRNAVSLSDAAFHPQKAIADDQAQPSLFGDDRIEPESIAELKDELAKNPAQAPAAAEIIRVFNAFFEFVELKLEGTAIERRTVPIPTELMGLANNAALRKRMRASFRLVGDGVAFGLSGRDLDRIKKRIVAECLTPLKGYGHVVVRSVKPCFEQKVKALQKRVAAFKKAVEQHLQQAIDQNREQLRALLLPAVRKNPPNRWKKFGPELDDETVSRLLDDELKKAFGSAKHLVGEMKVQCIFKGVTYESLTDADFVSTAINVIPNFAKLHREFDAVEVAHRAAGKAE